MSGTAMLRSRGIHYLQQLKDANIPLDLIEKGQNRGELLRALGGVVASTSLLGVPLGHNSSFLQGPAFAPPRIREAIWCGSTNSTTEEGKELKDPRVLTDVGDVPVQEIRDCGVDDDRLMNVISESVSLVMEQDPLRPLVLGGDHSISFPVVRAVSEKLGGPVDILHLDAHPDIYDAFEGNKYSHASSFARIMEGGYARRLLQVGIRSINKEGREQGKRFGVEQYEMRKFSRDRHFLENLKLGEGVKGVYISVDVDCLDPAFAPGVSHIEPGGLSFRDVLNILHNLQGNIVAADVVEFNPQRDTVDGMTAMVAAKLIADHMSGASMMRSRGIHYLQQMKAAKVPLDLIEKGQERIIDASLTLIRETAKLRGEFLRALGGVVASTSLLGVPLGHNSSFLQGPAFAPPLIREAMWCGSTNSTTEQGKDIKDPRVLTDVGDLPVQEIRDAGIDDDRLMNVVSESVKLVMEQDPLRPLVLGGDHSISYPVVRAISEKLGGPVDILHLDAHPDIYDAFEGNKYSHASSFARIMEGGYARRLLQVGIRSINKEGREQGKRFGVEQYEMRTFSRDRHFLENLKLGEGVKGVYISVDVDCLDPAFAPGVSHFEPGGLSFRDAMNILHNLQGNIVGADVVEFNPQRDISGGMTAMVAAKFVREIAARMSK
ncbi:Ureohydrolase [Corchorus capsularis]|uniref:Ureohydrolase n=1 Tax=Corchorus capsularis TaxID=210143 RepID=A0A1R3JZX0_COCAP|nr:Ureohydrolase [Corchorus capsularis]